MFCRLWQLLQNLQQLIHALILKKKKYFLYDEKPLICLFETKTKFGQGTAKWFVPVFEHQSAFSRPPIDKFQYSFVVSSLNLPADGFEFIFYFFL